MVAELLVTQAVEDGRVLLAALRRGGFEVTAAAWLRHAERGRWHLHLVAPMAATDMREAFGRVYDALRASRLAEVGYNSVRMVRPDEPLGRALRTAVERWADRVPGGTARYHSSDLSLLGYDDAHIYPPSGPMSPPEMLRAFVSRMVGGPATVDHLRANGMPVPTVMLVYKDGRSEQGYAVGLHAWGDVDPLDAGSDPVLHVKEVHPRPDDSEDDVHAVRLGDLEAVF